MALVAGVGIGTFLFLFFLAILVVFLLVAVYLPQARIPFLIFLALDIILWIILFLCPTESTKDVGETNKTWYIPVIFGILGFGGVIVAIVALFIVALTYADHSIIIPA